MPYVKLKKMEFKEYEGLTKMPLMRAPSRFRNKRVMVGNARGKIAKAHGYFATVFLIAAHHLVDVRWDHLKIWKT